MILTFAMIAWLARRLVTVFVEMTILGKWMLLTFDQFLLCRQVKTLPNLTFLGKVADLVSDDSSLSVAGKAWAQLPFLLLLGVIIALDAILLFVGINPEGCG